MTDPIVTLYESNFRDPVHTLRAIADEIEAGEYGPVGSLALVILGNTMEVFSAGEDSEPCSSALLLHSGFLRLSKAVEEHGQ